MLRPLTKKLRPSKDVHESGFFRIFPLPGHSIGCSWICLFKPIQTRFFGCTYVCASFFSGAIAILNIPSEHTWNIDIMMYPKIRIMFQNLFFDLLGVDFAFGHWKSSKGGVTWNKKPRPDFFLQTTDGRTMNGTVSRRKKSKQSNFGRKIRFSAFGSRICDDSESLIP